MKFGSLFAGIGGIDLGLERAGMTCVWQVEIDEFCLKVLEKHWPEIPKYGDVRDVGKQNLETVDLIAGGFPCQPHSVAGKRKGAGDDRNLWPEFSRVIAELKPRYVLAENVPGIVTTYIDTVLSDLESQGYICAIFNLPAVAFDAPHRRERIFIVAYSNGTRKLQSCRSKRTQRGWIGNGGENVSNNKSLQRPTIKRDEQNGILSEVLADTKIKQDWRIRQPRKDAGRISWWTIEPDVGRVAHGIPARVDRLRSLGNAVVPQVAEWIGKRIIEHDQIKS